MTEYPKDDDVDVLRSIITLCKNEGLAQLKFGPLELTFQKFLPAHSELDAEARKKALELQRKMEREDRFAAGGFVPNELVK